MMGDVDVDIVEVTSDTEDNVELEFLPSAGLTKKVTSQVWKFFVFRGSKEKGPVRDKVYCNLCPQGKKKKMV